MAAHSLEYRIYKISSESLLGRKTEQEKKKSVRNKPHGKGRTNFRFVILSNIPAFQQKIMRHSQQNKTRNDPNQKTCVDGLYCTKVIYNVYNC